MGHLMNPRAFAKAYLSSIITLGPSNSQEILTSFLS